MEYCGHENICVYVTYIISLLLDSMCHVCVLCTKCSLSRTTVSAQLMHVIEVHKIIVFLFQSHIVRHTACVYVFDSSHNIMCTLVIHEHMHSICTSIGKWIELLFCIFTVWTDSISFCCIW